MPSVDSAVANLFITTPVSGGPAWLAGLAEKTWTVIARGTNDGTFVGGATLSSKTPAISPGGGGVAGAVKAWTGAAVAQDFKEYIFAANGGHGDYWGNEVYALKLNQPIPGWDRYVDPTPAANLGSMDVTTAPRQYSDGRPASMHSANTPTYGNGKVYIMGQSAYSNIGNSNTSVWTWNRAAGPTLPEGYTGGAGRWAYLGDGTSPSQGGGFNCATFDPVANKAWGFHKIEGNDARWWSADAAGTVTRYTQNWSVGGIASMQHRSWAVCCYDLGIIVIGNARDNGVADTVLGIIDVTSPGTMTIKNTSTPLNMTQWGAVYHKPSAPSQANTSSILAYNQQIHSNGEMLKLRIPRTGGGAVDMAAAWNWITVNKAGGVSPGHEASDFAGTYSKFNIVNDMGNNQACIVLCTGLGNGYTFVYKLPTTEIS